MKLVDSHCHLDHEQFQGDLEAVLARAGDAGVAAVLCIGTGEGPPDLEAGIRLAEKYPQVYATVGVHPHDAAKASGETYRRLEELLAHPKVVALGETGLDYHYNFSPPQVQRAVFEAQLLLAAARSKPVIIHTREAWDDTIAMIRQVIPPKADAGIMHCFSGNRVQAEEAVRMGFLLGFGGIITFPKAAELREAARWAPDERILVETDAPYLAPVPYRGKRNEPAYMIETAKKLAEIRGQDPDHLAAVATANFFRLGLPGGNLDKYTGKLG